MKNKELRKQLLTNGNYHDYTQKRKKAFTSGCCDIIYKKSFDDESGELLNTTFNDDYFKMDLNDIEECERIRNAANKQRTKIQNHIEFLLNKSTYNVYFVTFTFKDEVLKLSPDTRRQKIRRLLNKASDDYILNIDYGKENDREHYHAIVAFKKNNDSSYYDKGAWIKNKALDEYDYGFYDMDLVNPIAYKKSDVKLSRYITKLTLHSVKVAQKYVSVKKGTEYQDYLKLLKAYNVRVNSDLGFWKDFDDELNAISY